MSSQPPSYHSENFYSYSFQNKKPTYHGPVTNPIPEQNLYKITTQYKYPHGYKYKKLPTQISYVQNIEPSHHNQIVLHKSLRKQNISNDIFIVNSGHLSNEMYFAEQKRLLENKHLDEMLKLESLKTYLHLQNL